MFRSFSLGLATLALLAAPAAAESFDVPGDFKTIQDAVDAADDGDTIILGNQDFFENVVIDGKTDLRIVGKGQVLLDGGFFDWLEDIFDRLEDVADRQEDIADRREDIADRREDVADRREDVRDRIEDFYDRRRGIRRF
mgnify:CR=1 FL=1